MWLWLQLNSELKSMFVKYFSQLRKIYSIGIWFQEKKQKQNKTLHINRLKPCNYKKVSMETQVSTTFMEIKSYACNLTFSKMESLQDKRDFCHINLCHINTLPNMLLVGEWQYTWTDYFSLFLFLKYHK